MTSPTSYFAAAWERWDRLAWLRAGAGAMPQVEPVAWPEPAAPLPPGSLIVAPSAPPVAEYVPPSYPFSGIDVAIEAEALGRLADLIADGMSPLAAAQAKFGAPHA